MRVAFQKSKLQRTCGSLREMQKAYGKDMATKLAQRLAELGAAANLSELSHLPPVRCHELIGNRKGQFSVDLVHPFRLVFVPESPIPLDAAGGIDRRLVVSIVILEVVDTH